MSVDEIIRLALAEDLGEGDHTTLATIPTGAPGSAKLLIKQEGILCGVNVAEAVFSFVDKNLVMEKMLDDGQSVSRGNIAFTVTGSRASILMAERVVLNFLQRLSGIATSTHRVVKLLEGLPVIVLDTRKTTPLLRELEKYAVRTGGGSNHRMGLYDMIMIKDNHIDYAGGIPKAIDAALIYLRKNSLNLKIEIEVRNFDELTEVLHHGHIDRIMLDNFSASDLKKAVDLIGGRYETEASGGITAANIREMALTGVTYISVGALTHQITSLDMSLKAC